jgi:hypothetical protein
LTESNILDEAQKPPAPVTREKKRRRCSTSSTADSDITLEGTSGEGETSETLRKLKVCVFRFSLFACTRLRLIGPDQGTRTTDERRRGFSTEKEGEADSGGSHHPRRIRLKRYMSYRIVKGSMATSEKSTSSCTTGHPVVRYRGPVEVFLHLPMNLVIRE